jgi:putative membrane protein, TIGR04086 family/integral membrane protein, TIGR04097 family
MRAESNGTESANVPKAAMMMLTGTLVSLATSMIMLLVFALVMTVKNVPQGVVPTLTAASIAIGSFAGGFTGARMHRKSGLFVGVVIGLCMYVLLMLAGLAFRSKGVDTTTLIKLVVSVISGGIGGVIGVNAHKKRNF